MARENFEEKLLQLKNQVILMSEMAKIALHHSIMALDNSDDSQAQHVIEQDQQINELENEINHFAIWLIAKEQPVAKDLRHLIVTLKVSNDIERIGDLAVNIAKSVRIIGNETVHLDKEEIMNIATIVDKMIDTVITAFFNEDVDLALAVAEMDDQIDRLYVSTINNMLHYMTQHKDEIKSVTQLAFICRYLERAADHVTNISENIIYLVKGMYIDLNS
ncbi:phosphate signaling complex protein PhoU [Bacillaceae bacterium W0354]